MLLGEPKRLNAPLWTLGCPLNVEMAHQLRDQFPHFHNRDVLANTRSRTVAKLDQQLMVSTSTSTKYGRTRLAHTHTQKEGMG
jgi:hypothetical protein